MTTIKDVAKCAGVSVGTVSKVINNISVKPNTKLVVEEAIKKLNYEPNEYARGLKINRTNTVALIIPTVWHPFFSELAYNIEKNLKKYNLKMILCNSEDDYHNELEYITMAKQNKVDGIIALTYSDVNKYISSNLPVISIDRHFSNEITSVSSDNFNGGKIAAEELQKAGCKKLLFIGSGSRIDNLTRQREKGFEKYCEENNISYESHYIIHENDYELNKKPGFKQFAKEFIKNNYSNNKIEFDGIFAVTDRHANIILNELNNLNIKVPENVQIIGFDGCKSSSEAEIKISTIRQPIEIIASEAVKSLIDLLENKPIKKEIIVPVHFIKGYTTK